MSSVAVQLADALAGGLNARAFSAPYASLGAVRRYVPDADGSSLDTLTVSVVPGPYEIDHTQARGFDVFSHSTYVVLAKHVQPDELDGLMGLQQEVADVVRSKLLVMPSMPAGAVWFSVAVHTTFDRDALTDKRLFLSQMEIVHRVPRDTLTS
jgi:hypothetical protein